VAISLVTSVTSTPPGTNGTTTSAINTTGANLIVLSVAYFATLSTVSDSKGNPWTPLTERTTGSTAKHRLYYALAPAVGPGHTFTVSGASIFAGMVVLAFTDTFVPIFESQNGAAGSTGTSVATGSLTPTTNGSLIISGVSLATVPQAISVNSALTAVTVAGAAGTALNGGQGYLVQGTAAAINPTWSWTTSAENAVSLAVFRPGVLVTGLARRQGTPQTSTVLNPTATVTFASPPLLGNAIILLLSLNGTGTVLTAAQITDTFGNTYVLVQDQTQSALHAAIFACLAVTATGSSFTITAALNGTNVSITGRALEVGGFTGAFQVDRVVGNGAASGLTPTSGTTAALQTAASQAFAVGVLITLPGVPQSSITVESVSPPWMQEHELLSGANAAYGEGDSRVLTSPGGTTQSVTWTITNSGIYAASLAVFAAPEPPGPPANTHIKAKLGNKHGKTNEHGAVVVVPATTPGTPGVIGPLTIFPHLCGETTDAGLQVTSVTAGALRTPRTPLGNLRVTTDDQGSLRVASVTAGVLGPLTDLGNLLCRTDETGALIVTSGPAGTLTSGPSPLLNLRGRTDDQGALVVTGLTAPSSLLTGLTSYWKLDEVSGTRVDAVGTNHLTPTNAPVGVAGKIGNACDLEFDSVQYLSCANNATFDLSATDFTFAGWMRPETLPSFSLVIFKDSSFFEVRTQDNQLVILINGVAAAASPAITVSTWAFFVCGLDIAADVLFMQMNNGAAVQTSTVLQPTASAVPFVLGARSDGSLSFDGLLDEVGFWRRVLTPAERTTLYNAGAGLTYPFA
jgi:hypothetical protein